MAQKDEFILFISAIITKFFGRKSCVSSSEVNGKGYSEFE